MNVFSAWSKSIVISVIITVVIEMILPENNSKKYIKIVLGIFIVYSIISPVFEFISNSSVDSIVSKGEAVVEASSASIKHDVGYQNVELYRDSAVRNIYSQSLQTEINKVLSKDGYVADKIDIVIADDDTYSINKISVNIKEKRADNDANKNKQAQSIVQTVKQIVIDIDKKSKNNGEDSIINESDKAKIIKVLHDNFGVDDNCIVIT